MSEQSSPTELTNPTMGNNVQEEGKNTTNVQPQNTSNVQPPLPPNPPPPGTPPMIINLKKEIVDDEYQSNDPKSQEYINTEELIKTTIKTDQETDEPKVIMCRNFVRGTCKKGAACIFAHKLILSQLPGVYTFCRNFQNSVCSFPKCKFVHATVFEKEHFFRSGYLPPHTLAHLKESAAPHLDPTTPQTEGKKSIYPTKILILLSVIIG